MIWEIQDTVGGAISPLSYPALGNWDQFVKESYVSKPGETRW